ncbi:MAG TPA: glycosyltransferase [Phycisphaerae bacterium]|nr:glycosyltransferase [Phycisphaerae bacterium]
MDIVGVVIIGRNEGSRLAACIRSIRAGAPPETPVVYVDSASTDDSVQIAHDNGADIVQLNPTIPFTAARARNAGAEFLLHRHPALNYLQFVDGDTEVHPRWILHALDYLNHHPHVAVVCGRRRERFPEASVYNLLVDMEWDTPIGIAEEFGGDSLIRAEAFRRVGGYRPEFIAGEEPDLAARLRLDGHSIGRLNHEMTLHNVAMTRFTQWWRRTLRSGHALAQLAHTHGRTPLLFYRRQWKSTLLWAVAVPLAILLLALIVTWWAIFLLPLAFAYLTARIVQHRIRRGDDRYSACAYGLFTALGKVPQCVGLARFYRSLWSKRPATIIEYKAAPNPATTPVGNT